MADRIFQHPFHTWRDARLQMVIDQIAPLKLPEITDERVNDIIDKGVNSPHFRIPKLNPTEKYATRSDAGFLNLYVPFAGHGPLLGLEPTQMTLIAERVVYHDQHIIVRMRDDERLENDLEVLLRDISGNLSNLERDIASLKLAIAQNVPVFAAERKAQLQAVSDRDKSRSFPIR